MENEYISGNQVIASVDDERVHAITYYNDVPKHSLLYSGVGILPYQIKEKFTDWLVDYSTDNIGVALNNYAQTKEMYNVTVEGWANINTPYNLADQETIS